MRKVLEGMLEDSPSASLVRTLRVPRAVSDRFLAVKCCRGVSRARTDDSGFWRKPGQTGQGWEREGGGGATVTRVFGSERPTDGEIDRGELEGRGVRRGTDGGRRRDRGVDLSGCSLVCGPDADGPRRHRGLLDLPGFAEGEPRIDRFALLTARRGQPRWQRDEGRGYGPRFGGGHGDKGAVYASRYPQQGKGKRRRSKSAQPAGELGHTLLSSPLIDQPALIRPERCNWICCHLNLLCSALLIQVSLFA